MFTVSLVSSESEQNLNVFSSFHLRPSSPNLSCCIFLEKKTTVSPAPSPPPHPHCKNPSLFLTFDKKKREVVSGWDAAASEATAAFIVGNNQNLLDHRDSWDRLSDHVKLLHIHLFISVGLIDWLVACRWKTTNPLTVWAGCGGGGWLWVCVGGCKRKVSSL